VANFSGSSDTALCVLWLLDRDRSGIFPALLLRRLPCFVQLRAVSNAPLLIYPRVMRGEGVRRETV
jgi:hypothetical protein